MIHVLPRASRAVLGASILLACADGNPPTQPTSVPAAIPAVPRASGDVVAADMPSTIYACYVPGKGSIYRIRTADTPSECEKKDIEFSWEAQPVRAIAGMTFHSEAVTLPSDGRHILQCPEGQSVVDAGWEIPASSTAQASQILGARPALISGRAAWGFHAAAGTLYVFYWTCAPADPVTSAAP